ncbi:hypothetical protein LCGC14_1351820 [marine sediment metagenome]|uniref:Homing endonuclease LAGLIDADG domain-containing protein n=1 Tax=marine sediment metagenome TaxID=412755 RepID=A0A0F9KAP2_9ZZZZ
MTSEYMAAFIDGEGSIRVRKGSRRPKNWSPSYELTIEVANTYRPVLDDIAAKYGGTVVSKKVRNPLKHKPQWVWIVASQRAADCLTDIRPYLREKEQQAWLGLEFWAQINRGGEFRRTGVPADQLALREGFYLAMRGIH